VTTAERTTTVTGRIGDSVQRTEADEVVDPIVARMAAIKTLLFRDPEETVYVILDGASVPGLPNRLAEAPDTSACLYRGELGLDLKMMAPYLVRLTPESTLLPWLWDEGWGKNWGVYLATPLEFEPLRRHLRGFLRVRDHQGKVLYFRYYDPRVLRVYLPTCNAGEIKTVFGSISRFLCESESPEEMLEFPQHRFRITPRTVLL
jgi:hypothetical protein